MYLPGSFYEDPARIEEYEGISERSFMQGARTAAQELSHRSLAENLLLQEWAG